MLNDPRLNRHPLLQELLQNIEEDLRLGRSDSAGTDLRKTLEYILKEYYLRCGSDPGTKSISEMLGELNRNRLFDPETHPDNHLTWKDKSFFYGIKDLGNSESHFDPAHPHQGRPSVAKATAAYEDLELFLPRFLADVPAMLRAPAEKSAPAPVRPARPAQAAAPAPAPAPEKPVRRAPVPVPRLQDFLACGPNDPCPCGSGKKYKNCCRDAKPPEALRHDLENDPERKPLIQLILELGDNRYGQLSYAMASSLDDSACAAIRRALARAGKPDGGAAGIQFLAEYFRFGPDQLRGFINGILEFQQKMRL